MKTGFLLLLCASFLSAGNPPFPELAFVRVERQSWIYLGLPAKKIAAGFFPALHPERKALAFCRAPREGKSDLLLVDLATRRERVLLASKAHIRNVRWSPSGNLISFLQFEGNEWSGHLLSPGGPARKVYPPVALKGKQLAGPEWAAGARSLVCHDGVEATEFDLQGNILRRTPVSSIAGNESVTPADSLLPCPTEPEVYLYTAGSALSVFDGKSGKRIRLSPSGLAASDPAWSQDGRTVYFSAVAERDGIPGIYRIARDGTGLTLLARGEQPAP